MRSSRSDRFSRRGGEPVVAGDGCTVTVVRSLGITHSGEPGLRSCPDYGSFRRMKRLQRLLDEEADQDRGNNGAHCMARLLVRLKLVDARQLPERARVDDEPAVRRLLSLGVPADLTGRNVVRQSKTALCYSAENDNAQLAMLLLDNGAGVDGVQVANTFVRVQRPLWLAAKRDNVAVAEVLLSAGADPLLPGYGGCTCSQEGGALSAAVKNGSVQVLALLLRRRPSLVSAICCLRFEEGAVQEGCEPGATALHLAVLNSRVQCAKMLLRAGADSSARTSGPGKLQPLHLLGPAPHISWAWQSTLWEDLERRPSFTLAEALLLAGALPNSRDGIDMRPLQRLCHFLSIRRGTPRLAAIANWNDTVRVLVQFGAEVSGHTTDALLTQLISLRLMLLAPVEEAVLQLEDRQQLGEKMEQLVAMVADAAAQGSRAPRQRWSREGRMTELVRQAPGGLVEEEVQATVRRLQRILDHKLYEVKSLQNCCRSRLRRKMQGKNMFHVTSALVVQRRIPKHISAYLCYGYSKS